jgi:16S rRNA (guanine(1405)-N(7))-methyltransferase
MGQTDDSLDRLVAAVLSSPKHGRICAEFVRRVGAEELTKRRSLKEAIKATKNKLHQVGGAYLEGSLPYARWLDRLREAPSPDDLRAACRDVMRGHTSTAERLGILDEFYSALLGGLPPVRSVLDVACGLNPLAIPWMSLAPDAVYYAYDIYQDMTDFIGEFMALIGMEGHAQARDVMQFVPPEKVDLALILKTIPCLEQVDKAAGRRLLDGVNADTMIVSFPVRSLGGHDKGMSANYEAHLRDLLADRDWPVERYEFESELAFLIHMTS